MIQNRMFHLLFIYFQVTFWFTLGPTYTFVPSHLLIHFRAALYFWNVYFRGFVITFSQGWPIIFHIILGYLSLHLVKVDLQCSIQGLLHITNFYMNSASKWWWFVALCLIFDINGNLIQQSTLCHWWKHSCSPCHHAHFFLSPFDINGKGNSP